MSAFGRFSGVFSGVGLGMLAMVLLSGQGTWVTGALFSLLASVTVLLVLQET